jgi:hypothetical protein
MSLRFVKLLGSRHKKVVHFYDIAVAQSLSSELDARLTASKKGAL